MDTTLAHRVLLVEDNDPDVVRLMLKRSRNPVAQAVTLVEVGDLASARAELAGAPFDLILLDVQLPDGTGLSLAQEVAAQAAPRPVVVAVTASALPSEREKVLAYGCDDFISKPYHPQTLVDVVVTHLTGSSEVRA